MRRLYRRANIGQLRRLPRKREHELVRVTYGKRKLPKTRWNKYRPSDSAAFVFRNVTTTSFVHKISGSALRYGGIGDPDTSRLHGHGKELFIIYRDDVQVD